MIGIPIGLDKALTNFLSVLRTAAVASEKALGASPFEYKTMTANWDPPSLTNGSSATLTVSFPGASTGDTVLASLNSITTGGWQLTGMVIQANTVSLLLVNRTGGTVNLPFGTVRIDLFHKG